MPVSAVHISQCASFILLYTCMLGCGLQLPTCIYCSHWIWIKKNSPWTLQNSTHHYLFQSVQIQSWVMQHCLVQIHHYFLTRKLLWNMSELVQRTMNGVLKWENWCNTSFTWWIQSQGWNYYWAQNMSDWKSIHWSQHHYHS